MKKYSPSWRKKARVGIVTDGKGNNPFVLLLGKSGFSIKEWPKYGLYHTRVTRGQAEVLTLLPAAHVFNNWEQRRAVSASSEQNAYTKKWGDDEKWCSVGMFARTIFTLIHIVLLLNIWGVILLWSWPVLPAEPGAECTAQHSLHTKKGAGWWEMLWPWCISISLKGYPEGLQRALALLSATVCVLAGRTSWILSCLSTKTNIRNT